MSELLELLEGTDFAQLFWLLKLVLLAVAVMAVAAAVYVTKAMLTPTVRVVKWLFAYKSGSKPGEITAGVGYGARMVAWAVLIAFTLWFCIH